MTQPILTALRTGALALALLGGAPLAAGAQAPGAEALISRAALFGNPVKSDARLSPDGKWLSFLAPRAGVMNLWIAPADHPAAARPLTQESGRPIQSYFWAANSRQLLYVNDTGGDENYRLYGVDALSGARRTYTDDPHTRVEVIKVSPAHPDAILIALNARDPRWHDVFRLDLATGKRTEVFRNEGYAGITADDALRVRLVARARADGGRDYLRVTNGVVETRPLLSIGLDDALTTTPLSFTADGRTLYWLSSAGRDTAALTALDMKSGESGESGKTGAGGAMRVLGEDARADVEAALFDPVSGRAQAFEAAYLAPEYTALDPQSGSPGSGIAGDLAFLAKAGKGLFTIESRTRADDRWVVRFEAGDRAPESWLYTRKGHRLTRLFASYPALDGAPLAERRAVVIKARDGLDLVSYLTLPRGAKGPVPLVLFVHGGPWARDRAGFQAYHEWLANRGYAVLAVNFRSSTGFGKAFIAAGNREWGRKMHEDILDAADWAVRQGITTQGQIAILGGSYGGYETLVGMTMTPEAFACGVDMVGPSNLLTLMDTFPAYWKAELDQFHQRMGNPETEEGRAMLKARSPITYAGQIARPLLIAQGANDPRVNIRESDQIVAAMRARHIPVTYLVFPDEGHGFARPENAIAFAAAAETFLGHCLGGRVEPIGEALARSSGEVREGGDYIGVKDTQASAR
ncbi:S9 family peptidase [Novosphingobium sp. 1949]|uniref:S9 family peptidase n=1 Tax=Novosphingobium organovorum TaxID=2930092 RepID=A0ABT0BIF0_9SPHN|nr:S9 family peptidase [Novosphingobium organovorum]MCJ2184499.1 S9 family peptidase [Novosphingobium organovorum]